MKKRNYPRNAVDSITEIGKVAENARQSAIGNFAGQIAQHTDGSTNMTTTEQNAAATIRQTIAATLGDTAERLCALLNEEPELELEFDMLAVRTLAAYMQTKGAALLTLPTTDVAPALAVADVAPEPKAAVPDQVVGRRPTEAGQRRIRTQEGAAIDRAVWYFADVLTLLGAASCRGVAPSLAQDLVLMAHATTMFGLDELGPYDSAMQSDAG
jgi:hypothetical protein